MTAATPESTRPPSPSRVWAVHALLLVLVLGPILAWLALSDAVSDFLLSFAFFFVPLALAYAAVSTAMVLVLRRWRWGVVLAHLVALAAGAAAAGLFTTSG